MSLNTKGTKFTKEKMKGFSLVTVVSLRLGSVQAFVFKRIPANLQVQAFPGPQVGGRKSVSYPNDRTAGSLPTLSSRADRLPIRRSPNVDLNRCAKYRRVRSGPQRRSVGEYASRNVSGV